FGIGGAVLIALDVRPHVLRRHQSHLVAKRAQLPRPVVRRRARLQANQTGRQSTEERQNLRTPKLLAQNRRSLCIDPVHLKNMLRQVQSDRSNLAHGWLPFAADSIRQQFGTQLWPRAKASLLANKISGFLHVYVSWKSAKRQQRDMAKWVG